MCMRQHQVIKNKSISYKSEYMTIPFYLALVMQALHNYQFYIKLAQITFIIRNNNIPLRPAYSSEHILHLYANDITMKSLKFNQKKEY